VTQYRIKLDMLLCQGHGVCADECPEVFEVVETEGYSKVSVKTATPSPELNAKLEEAAKYCPNGTITLVEID
jgi:ferredoxin